MSFGVVASLAGSATLKFGGFQSYCCGAFPTSAAIGDLNGDGKPDLAVANDASDTVSVLFNRGGGRFRGGPNYRTGSGPIGVVIGDLNGDGKPDLVTANYSGSVSVLLNRGAGSFAPRVDYATGSGPWQVAIGDLNGDGKPDLAVANSDPDTVSVLLGRGDGTFQAKVDYATGTAPIAVAIADLNGDGRPDLVTANALADTVSVLLNKGDGSLEPKIDYPTDVGPYSVAVGDVNGDGKPDLVTPDYGPPLAPGGGNTATVLVNRGDGSFEPKVDYSTVDDPLAVALSDLNGDGKPDLVVAGSACCTITNTITVRLNGGDGSFKARRDFDSTGDPVSMAVGDLNRDGRPDLVTTNQDGTVIVMLNATGLCSVPRVVDRRLSFAKRAIFHADCSVGKIRRAYSNRVRFGRVISESPRWYTVLPYGAKVSLVVSRGRGPDRFMKTR